MVLLSNQSFELGILQMKLYCVQSQYALHNIEAYLGNCGLLIVHVISLGRTYAALETLTEPHQLTATLQCVSGVSRTLLEGGKGRQVLSCV